jgi:hypothetical protein
LPPVKANWYIFYDMFNMFQAKSGSSSRSASPLFSRTPRIIPERIDEHLDDFIQLQKLLIAIKDSSIYKHHFPKHVEKADKDKSPSWLESCINYFQMIASHNLIHFDDVKNTLTNAFDAFSRANEYVKKLPRSENPEQQSALNELIQQLDEALDIIDRLGVDIVGIQLYSKVAIAPLPPPK